GAGGGIGAGLWDGGDWGVSDPDRNGRGVGAQPGDPRLVGHAAELGVASASSVAHLDRPAWDGRLRGGRWRCGDVPAVGPPDQGKALWNAVFALTFSR